jgi:signal transduction histidine kinase
MIVLLNCASQIRANQRFVNITFIIFFTGLLIALIIVWYASSRVIAPEIENVRRQKQFITNASHELKTPLAVIRANTEVLEMIEGENEWTASTMRQVDRMSGLIGNLVQIARAEERADKSRMTSLTLSRCVAETADTFEPVATSDSKSWSARSRTM